MKFLWNSSADGHPSTSKLWKHIAYAVATYIVLTMQNVTWEVLLVYMAIVGGSEVASKLIALRYGGGGAKDDNKQETTTRPSPPKGMG